MGKSNDAEKIAKEQRRDEVARQNRIKVGTAHINQTFDSQFTPAYFDGRRQAYLDYATPQLQDQFSDVERQLAFSLARAGTLDSSIAAKKNGDLQKDYQIQQQQLQSAGEDQATQARNSVEDARAGLISMLQATADVEGASKGAIARAQTLTAKPAYQPLGQVFTTFTDTLGMQAAAERAYALGSPQAPTYNTGLFAPRNAVKVT